MVAVISFAREVVQKKDVEVKANKQATHKNGIQHVRDHEAYL